MHDDLFACLLRPSAAENRFAKLLRLRRELRLPHAVVVVAGPGESMRQVGRGLRGYVHRCAMVEAVDEWPAHVALVIPVLAPNQMDHALDDLTDAAARKGCLILPEAPVVGPRAVQASYQRAVLYAALALQLRLAGPRVDATLLAISRALGLLDTDEQAVILEPLRSVLVQPAIHRDAYIETIEVTRREGSVAATARALHVHPNTVRYRMERVHVMTGLDLINPMHRLRLDLAVLLYNFQRGSQAAATPLVAR
jgi:DNA-binding PucR family transcriptional regulator